MSIKSFLPTKISNKRCFLLIGILIILYIIENLPTVRLMDSYTFNYIIKPILWICIIIIVWQLPNIKPKGKLKLRKFMYFWAFNFAVIYIIISILAGLIDGFGKSPYNHSFSKILTNIIFFGSSLVGRELIRSYVVNSFVKEESYLKFISIAFFMAVTSISFSRYTSISNLQDFVKLVAQYFAPEFSQNLFATYLVYLGGPLASIIYLGIIQAFHWLSPILPDLKWITTALIGILCPVFFIISFQTIYYTESREIRGRDDSEENPISWIITSILSIGIIWFSVGVFPIYPSVIATGSMEPMIRPGDVILVKKITDMEGINNLKVGDVIQFRSDGVLISHRIIEIIHDQKEGVAFKTKGDNNPGPDSELVKPHDIKGIIVYTIPKIGWPTLLLKSDRDIPLGEIFN